MDKFMRLLKEAWPPGISYDLSEMFICERTDILIAWVHLCIGEILIQL